jgi:hypothetical protein
MVFPNSYYPFAVQIIVMNSKCPVKINLSVNLYSSEFIEQPVDGRRLGNSM